MGPEQNTTAEGAHCRDDPGLMVRMHREIEGAKVLLIDMDARIGAVADQVFGHIPSATDGTEVNESRAEPYSHVEVLHLEIDQLHASIRSLNDQIARFYSLV